MRKTQFLVGFSSSFSALFKRDTSKKQNMHIIFFINSYKKKGDNPTYTKKHTHTHKTKTMI